AGGIRSAAGRQAGARAARARPAPARPPRRGGERVRIRVEARAEQCRLRERARALKRVGLSESSLHHVSGIGCQERFGLTLTMTGTCPSRYAKLSSTRHSDGQAKTT